MRWREPRRTRRPRSTEQSWTRTPQDTRESPASGAGCSAAEPSSSVRAGCDWGARWPGGTSGLSRFEPRCGSCPSRRASPVRPPRRRAGGRARGPRFGDLGAVGDREHRHARHLRLGLGVDVRRRRHGGRDRLAVRGRRRASRRAHRSRSGSRGSSGAPRRSRAPRRSSRARARPRRRPPRAPIRRRRRPRRRGSRASRPSPRSRPRRRTAAASRYASRARRARPQASRRRCASRGRRRRPRPARLRRPHGSR